MSDFFLPKGYISRIDNEYFDDTPFSDSPIVYQPELYPVAEYYLAGTHRNRIVDVGCGSGRKLAQCSAPRKMGLDFGSNIAFCKNEHGTAADWIEIDLDYPLSENAHCALLDEIGAQDVVICSDVIEHLRDPMHLLNFLRQCFDKGALVITSTPERVLVRGAEHLGPPNNPAHVREWSLAEYGALLAAAMLPATFLGLTINNNVNRQLHTIISVHEPRLEKEFQHAPVRPLAIISTYNEEDVIGEVIDDWIKQGCDIHVIDNWSTDASWNILCQMSAKYGRHLQIERFPEEPSSLASWYELLKRKEDIALCHRGRWIIHTDADEIRRSPFTRLNFPDALHAMERNGWNRVPFTLVNFRPTTGKEYFSGTLHSAFRHFEFGDKPGHFIQHKAWLQGQEKVDLASSGGHLVSFPGATSSPYHFLLRHYPIRSDTHGRRKIFSERTGRWSAEDLAKGWHHHYLQFSQEHEFIWSADALHKMEDDFLETHGLAILTGLMEYRTPDRGA